MAMVTPFIRTDMLEPEQAPRQESGVIGWLRHNLFGSIFDSVLTILALLFLIALLPPIFEWLFVNATWSGADRSVCATVAQGGTQPDGWSGACWAYVGDYFQQFMYGTYPMDQRWRPSLVAALFVILLAPLLIPKVPHKGWNALALFVVFPIIAAILLLGGVFGLPFVETAMWGGLMVTLIISFVGIAVSLMGRNHPAGIVLAAILFGILYQGGDWVSFEMPNITREMIVVIQGLVILFAGALEYMCRPALARLYYSMAKRGV